MLQTPPGRAHAQLRQPVSTRRAASLMREALQGNEGANDCHPGLWGYVAAALQSATQAQSHCHKVCPICGKWCVQPPGHGGRCYCPNQHSGYW